MTREQLEHLIRAAATIADDDEIIIVGSQSVLGQFPDAPAELLRSNEADVTPKNHPDRWSLVDGSIGELSGFHDTFGYYAQGVPTGTAILPRGWEQRAHVIQNANTRGARGICPEIHDLLIAKYIAGRDKDRSFAQAAARHGLATRQVLEERLSETDVLDAVRKLTLERIRADFSA